MHCLFLNQYAPPDSPPTARLLGELADFLRRRGHTVEIVAPQETYGGRPAGGGGRLRREVTALGSILRVGWRRRTPQPDVVLALSSPPGLPVVGAILAWRHRARLAHWAMDLYPELAVTLGEVPAGQVARLVGAAMRWAYRRAALVVALDDDMRAHLQPFCRAAVRVLAPWPSLAAERQLSALGPADPAGNAVAGPWRWLYSGNLGRAHEWQTLLDAQHLLERKGFPVHLVFQGDGTARAAARAHAEHLGLQRCVWQGYVTEDELLPSLLSARALVVTQRPETRGLLWPSKLAVLEQLPRPILFVGPTEGAIARSLHARGNAGVFAPGASQAVADWIESLFSRAPDLRPPGAFESKSLEGCATLERWLAEGG